MLTDLEMLLRDDFGVVTTRQLRRVDIDTGELRRLRAAGALSTIRRGWHATPVADRRAVRAVTVGGVVACATALAMRGVWVPHQHRLHIRRSDHHGRLRADLSGVSVCNGQHDTASCDRSVDDVETAVSTSLQCLDEESIVVVLDSVVQRKLLSRLQVEAMLQRQPRRIRRLIDWIDPRSESGTETMARVRLRRRGIRVRTQVRIEAKRVDLVIGDWLIVEIDGHEFHSDRAAFDGDRLRDRKLMTLGYPVIRLTYDQVVHHWADAEADIIAIVRAGGHMVRVGHS